MHRFEPLLTSDFPWGLESVCAESGPYVVHLLPLPSFRDTRKLVLRIYRYGATWASYNFDSSRGDDIEELRADIAEALAIGD